MMRFGASTLMKGKVEEFFDGAKDSFEVVEVVCDAPYKSPLEINTQFLRSVKKALGIEYTIHSPYTSMDIGSLDDSYRKQCVDRVLEAIEVGCAIGAHIVVVHPAFGSRGSLEERLRVKEMEKDSLEKINESARSKNMKICIENMPMGIPFVDRSLASGIIQLAKGLDGAGVTLDVAHANTTNVKPETMMKHFGPELLSHVHVHDNRGTSDDHLEIGKGTVNWGNVAIGLRQLRYDGVLVDESLNIEAARRGIRLLKQKFQEVDEVEGKS